MLASLLGLAVWLACLCSACTVPGINLPSRTSFLTEPTLSAENQTMLESLPALHGEISQQLAGTRWRLMIAAVQDHPLRSFDGQPMLEFLSANQYRGSDGCNMLSGVYQTSAEGEFFHAGTRTKKACLKSGPNHIMVPYETDARFYEWFQQTRAFQVNGSELRLFLSDNHSDMLIFVKYSAHLPGRRFGFTIPQ